jgi:cobyrinic acid a,c-diamide synthase
MPVAPRLLISGLSGGGGKTLVSSILLLLLRREGIDIRAFKKGPDYIDPAWLAWASEHPVRNIDTFLMGPELAADSFARHALSSGINVIEGNRGLFDGSDAQGTHSSATLAKLLSAPVLLVVDASKMTATAAALVRGCQVFDPCLLIGGVVLNNVSGNRHKRILRSAIESACGVPVVGSLPRMKNNPLPERHLGLVLPQERNGTEELACTLIEQFGSSFDLDAIVSMARSTSPLDVHAATSAPRLNGEGLRIGYLRDSAFTFYYPENLEALERAGAELVSISVLTSSALPANLHALYIGGGFPEMHSQVISANVSLLGSLRNAARRGLPIYAECGGLMLLARTLTWKQKRFQMAGVLPIDVEVFEKPQGHGYTELLVDRPNAFFPEGTTFRGHEFHYSRVVSPLDLTDTAYEVRRGVGCSAGRDGMIVQNVLAGYTHLHSVGSPQWAYGLLQAAANYRDQVRAASILSCGAA